MVIDPNLIQLTTKLTELAVRAGASVIFTKIETAKQHKNDEQKIQALIEIINNLQTDNTELVQIAKSFQEEVASQKISDDEIVYITENIIPTLEKMVNAEINEEKRQSNKDFLNVAKTLLSKEFVTISQLLGFNYREAIGIPLTKLCADAISNSRETKEQQNIQELTLKNQTMLADLSRDRKAYNRFARMMGMEKIIDNDSDDNSSNDMN